MSYTNERDHFIAAATAEGLSLDTCRRLLRYATTLHRLAEAQCNGDWPFNGDRDRPLPQTPEERARWDKRYVECPNCQTSGVCVRMMVRSAYRVMVDGKLQLGQRVCPDCRTQELVRALLANVGQPDLTQTSDSGLTDRHVRSFTAIFAGDPRGPSLTLSTPNHPWTENGRGRGLYVPARSTR